MSWMRSMKIALKIALSCMWGVLRKEKLLVPKFDLLLQACGFERKSASSMPSVSNEALYWPKDNLHGSKLLYMAIGRESSKKNYVRSDVWGQKEIWFNLLLCFTYRKKQKPQVTMSLLSHCFFLFQKKIFL